MWIPAAQLWGLSPVLRVWRTRGAWVVAADGEHLEGAASQPPDTPRLWALLCSETGIIANPSSLRMKRELAPLAKAAPAWQEGHDHPNLGPSSPRIVRLGLGLPFPAMSSLNRNKDPVYSPNAPFLWLEELQEP